MLSHGFFSPPPVLLPLCFPPQKPFEPPLRRLRPDFLLSPVAVISDKGRGFDIYPTVTDASRKAAEEMHLLVRLRGFVCTLRHRDASRGRSGKSKRWPQTLFCSGRYREKFTATCYRVNKRICRDHLAVPRSPSTDDSPSWTLVEPEPR